MEDSRIVDLFFARDERAIAEAMQAYGEKLRRLPLGLGLNAQDAEELENDAYRIAWDRIPPEAPRDHLFAFLAKIVRERAIDRCRAMHRDKRSAILVELNEEIEGQPEFSEAADSALSAAELSRAVSAFLRTVSAEKRNIFLRRYWFADAVGDIAKRFSVSESKVKVTLFRLRKDLAAYLKKEGYMG